MINPYTITSVNYKNVALDKEYNRNLDLVELVRTVNSLNNQLVEAKIKLKHLEQENKHLKQNIKELEFRAMLK